MTRNITLALDESVLRDARILAAQQGLSISAILRRELVRLVEGHRRYSAARSSAMRRLAKGQELGSSRLPSREELHDRAGLR